MIQEIPYKYDPKVCLTLFSPSGFSDHIILDRLTAGGGILSVALGVMG